MASKVQGSPVQSPAPAQSETTVRVRPDDLVIALFKTANKMIQDRNFLPISVQPRQQLVITDIPKENHEQIRKIVQAGGNATRLIQQTFASLLTPGYFIDMRGTNGVDLDFVDNGTLVVHGAGGVLIYVQKEPKPEDGKEPPKT